jgi:hypothetical protein
MTLADYALPIPYSQAKTLALVFSPELRDRMVAVQSQYGRPDVTCYPAGPLPDGRYWHSGDMVSEYAIAPGGMYAASFAHLDSSRFDEIEVVPIATLLGQ